MDTLKPNQMFVIALVLKLNSLKESGATLRNKKSIPAFVSAYSKHNTVKTRKKGKQKESILQRQIVESLNISGIGYFFRIRNGATFDVRAGFFRANTAEPGIPDIIGTIASSGRAVFIEVKYIEKVENKKKLTFKVNISEDQKNFLRKAERTGALAGVAFNLEDARAIVMDHPHLYPRHPRTVPHWDKKDIEIQKEIYVTNKHELSLKNQDPLFRDVIADKELRNGKGK